MAYEYEVDGKVYKLQTANIYSPSSKKDIPIYSFREELMNGWKYVDDVPEHKEVTINKVTGIPFLISRIRVHPCKGHQVDLEDIIREVEEGSDE
jgi:hypothetical protein